MPSRAQLTALDQAFLANERGGAHLHVGAIFLCEGPPPSHESFVAALEGRLDRVPRYRQRLVHPPFALGRPAWVDDPAFDISYHVRRTALPAPGDLDDVRRLAARIFSQRLDRTKSLWELWVVEGLEDGRFALINKTHHAMVDGISGMDVTTALFDLERSPAADGTPPQPWNPLPPPSSTELVSEAVRDAVRRPLRMTAQALGSLTRPEAAVAQVRDAVSGVAEVGSALVDGQPRSILNGPPSSHRRLAWFGRDLGDYKAVKNQLGGTLNDVYLATVTGALRGYLADAGTDPAGAKVRAMVPVSVRSDGERGALGNRIAGMSVLLPLHLPDPVARLQAISVQLAHLKTGNMAVGAQVVADLQELAPPTILAQASRLQFSSRLYNVLISNVPGPQFPVYVHGRELLEFVPVAFLGPDKRIAFVAASYNGSFCTSVLGSREHLGSMRAMSSRVERELEALQAAAG